MLLRKGNIDCGLRSDHSDFGRIVELVHLDDFNQKLAEFEIGGDGEPSGLGLIFGDAGVQEVLHGTGMVPAVENQQQPE